MKKKNIYTLIESVSFTQQLLLTIIFNTVIALLIYTTYPNNVFTRNFMVSQTIGLSIFGVFHSVYYLRFRLQYHCNLTLFWSVLTLMAGALIGVSVVFLLSADLMGSYTKNIIPNLLTGIIFGTIIINYFSSRVRISNAESELQKHRITLLDGEKRMLESNLKCLQSQIEPHFLFNTLSNIIGLIDKNPARGKAMLQSLTHYLRATLEYTRIDSATLEDELKMVEAYLAIYKERMGHRLQYKINVPDTMRSISFPPMLLQPLVENAVKHGLESQVKGGYVNIVDLYKHDTINLAVEDSGIGLKDEIGKGVGLANVQQRLNALYGEQASLSLENNQPTGLRVIIEVPREKISRNYSG
ncbi:MAG: hypothetical protein GXP18_06880 [Gammaproteobacteria bacterium]|nr:hypothetical protein [Gammaproteobacteria bacterium]